MSDYYNCEKCLGKGHIQAFGHILGGVCFSCKGEGKIKKKKNPSKSFRVSFLWDDKSDVNYMNGDFCACGIIKSKTEYEAIKKAKKRMISNGSVAYRVEAV